VYLFQSGGCFPPHNSVFLLIRFGYFLLVLVRVCLGFFTFMDYVDSCEIRSDFTFKMRSEIDVFDVNVKLTTFLISTKIFCENCNLYCWKAKRM